MNVLSNVIYFCDQSWIFSLITFRNISNMMIWCSRNISDYH